RLIVGSTNTTVRRKPGPRDVPRMIAPKRSAKPRRRIGRPPAGARAGERVKDYPQLSVRLPDEARARLQALSLVSSRPQWAVITEATGCYVRGRPDAERRKVAQIAGRARPRKGR